MACRILEFLLSNAMAFRYPGRNYAYKGYTHPSIWVVDHATALTCTCKVLTAPHMAPHGTARLPHGTVFAYPSTPTKRQRESVWVGSMHQTAAAVLRGPSAHCTRPSQLEFQHDLQRVTISMCVVFYVRCGHARVACGRTGCYLRDIRRRIDPRSPAKRSSTGSSARECAPPVGPAAHSGERIL